GVAAQREIITNHLKEGVMLNEYVETETGKRNDRPKLMQALEQCRKTNSILAVAKLDRLSRNVAFTSKLLESDVEILFCDFPEANRLILHIISSIAEYEANLISIRTRQSLQAKKSRGYQLGKSENLMNRHRQAIANSNKTNTQKAIDNANNRRAAALIKAMANDNKTFAEITKSLNSQGFKTSRGGQFQIVQVQRIYKKYCVSMP
ncbi:MAG: recombinase family protein, partial [Tannerella sp.]|nr:recombinase family protein [Tannerella sp.]